MRNNGAQTGGIGFFGVLAIVFITLKLVGVIDWSWWLVLLPLWIAPALVGIVALGILILMMIGK